MFIVNNNRNNSGFTLIETAMVLVIIGIFVGFAIRLIMPGIEYMRVSTTEQRLEKIANRLAAFAIKNNRIPCPALPDGSGAEPFGYEIGSGSSGDNHNTTCEDNDELEGIVPFMTLGIAQEDTKDGWGRFITYRISPVFSLDLDPYDDEHDKVHLACRSFKWFGDVNAGNLNPDKARFCCPPIGATSFSPFYPTTDIEIRDSDGNDHWASARTDEGDNYDDVDTRISNIDDVDPTVNPDVLANEAIAFVLVSHGKNAFGAFTGTTATGRFATTNGQNGTDEDENQNLDNIFVSKKIDSTNDNTYFDDLLLWRTQHQLFTEFGEDTCLNP